MQLAELVEFALALPPAERICLLEKIEESLPLEDEISAEHLDEIERRAESYARGESTSVNAAIVLAELEAK